MDETSTITWSSDRKSVSGPQFTSGTFQIRSKSANNSSLKFRLFTAFWDGHYRELNWSAVIETSKPCTSPLKVDSHKFPLHGLVNCILYHIYTSSVSCGWVGAVSRVVTSGEQSCGFLALSQHLFTLIDHIKRWLALNALSYRWALSPLFITIITKNAAHMDQARHTKLCAWDALASGRIILKRVFREICCEGVG